MKLRFARLAERDLQEIGDWIAWDDPAAAGRLTAELAEKARQIAAMPFAFSAVGSSGTGRLRKRSHRRYIIYYRVNRASVTILRFLRHSRDQAAQLRKS